MLESVKVEETLTVADCLARARACGLGLVSYFRSVMDVLSTSELIAGLTYESAIPSEQALVRHACWGTLRGATRAARLETDALHRLTDLVRSGRLERFEQAWILRLMTIPSAGRRIVETLLADPDIWLAGTAGASLLEPAARPLGPEVQSRAVGAVWTAYVRESDGTANWDTNDGVHDLVRNRLDLFGDRLLRRLGESVDRGELAELDLGIETRLARDGLPTFLGAALFRLARHSAAGVAEPARAEILRRLASNVLPETAEEWSVATDVCRQTLQHASNRRILALQALAHSPARLQAKDALPYLEEEWPSLSAAEEIKAAAVVGALASEHAQAASLFQRILTDSPPAVATAAVSALPAVSDPLRAVLRDRLRSLPVERLRTDPSWQQLALAIGTRLERRYGPCHVLSEPAGRRCGYEAMTAYFAEAARRQSAEILGGDVWVEYCRGREASDREQATQATPEQMRVERLASQLVELLERYARNFSVIES